MYGYVRPLKPELKIREFELYNAAYCGLCHRLGKSYGLLARFAVSYDCTLPALMAAAQSPVCAKRCPARLGRKKPCLCDSDGLDRVAAATVILADYKLRDSVSDSGFFKGLGARILRLLGKGKFKKASAAWPEFAALAESCLSELNTLENTAQADPGILDRTADCFARLVAGFSLMQEGSTQRLWHEIFYHIGRVVYILDAADDAEADIKSGNFNPAVIRYQIKENGLTPETKESIFETLEFSLASAAAAFELLEDDSAAPIVGNIIYLGIPATIKQVLNKSAEKER